MKIDLCAGGFWAVDNRKHTDYIQAVSGIYSPCVLCPRRCSVLRGDDERGFCGEAGGLRIASAVLHKGEEPPLVHGAGSGAVFITGCNLKCSFCQNHQIAGGMGRAVTKNEFVDICKKLSDSGASNINIVTGSHAIPEIARYIESAKRVVGLPFLWNSSAYETLEALSLLDGLIDIYLPDLKTLDKKIAARYFTPDYPEIAAAAILRMIDKTPLAWEGAPFESALTRGVIVRHLALPAELDATEAVLRWFSKHGKHKALFSLMTQYTPPKKDDGKSPARFLDGSERDMILAMLENEGIEDGFFQELSFDNSALPDFNEENPFLGARQENGEALAKAVWHWRIS